MEYEWRITDEAGGDPTPIIMEILKGCEHFKPQMISVDSEHAVHVEFGTLPSTAPARPKEQRDKPTEVELRFREWVKVKFEYTDQAQINATAHRIYKDIMNNGMHPQPFMRPAMYYVMDSIEAENDLSPYLDEHSVQDMAFWIVEEMKRCLTANDINATFDLYNSINDPVEFDPEADLDSEVNNLPSAGNVPPELWNSRTEGIVPGRGPPARYRGLM